LTGAEKGVKWRLATLLGQVPAMADDLSRQMILAMMRDDGFELSLSQARNVPFVCMEAISQAAARAGALHSLAAAVVFLESNSGPARLFDEEVRRQLPSEFFTLDDRLRFVAWVDASVEPEFLPMYYQLATGDDSTVEFTDASGLVGALEDRCDDEESHPLILLAHEVAVRKRSRQVTRQARDWCGLLADLIDASRRDGRTDERAKLSALWKKQYGRRPLADAEHATTLMFQIDPHGPNPDAEYVLRVWLCCGGRPPIPCQTRDKPASLDVIKQDVVRQLQKVNKQLRQPGFVPDIMLEFFLPRNLLDHAVEDWEMSEPGVLLGEEYMVVVRDRARVDMPDLWPRWQRKWNRIGSAKPGQYGPFSRWITCADAPCGQGGLHSELLADDVVSLGLTFPPHPVTRGRHELSEALAARVPVVVWPHTRCPHRNPAGALTTCPGLAFRDRLGKKLSGHTLADLPGLVREMRQAGVDLALMWDDADRHPPTAADFELDAPQYLGDI
jgi:hypothetical protein